MNIWPKDDWKTRSTVLGGFGLLITAKVCPFIFLPCVALGLKCLVQVLNVQVPLLFKHIEDSMNMNVDIMARSTAWFLAGFIIIGCTSSSSSYPGPGKLLLVGVRDFADLRPKNRQTPALFFVDLRA